MTFIALIVTHLPHKSEEGRNCSPCDAHLHRWTQNSAPSSARRSHMFEATFSKSKKIRFWRGLALFECRWRTMSKCSACRTLLQHWCLKSKTQNSLSAPLNFTMFYLNNLCFLVPIRSAIFARHFNSSIVSMESNDVPRFAHSLTDSEAVNFVMKKKRD